MPSMDGPGRRGVSGNNPADGPRRPLPGGLEQSLGGPAAALVFPGEVRNLHSLGAAAWPPTGTSGIPGICISRRRRSVEHSTGNLWPSTQSSDISTSSLCFRQRPLTRENGQNCSRRRVPGMPPRWRSMTMASRCTGAGFLPGTHGIWGLTGISWEN